MPRTACGIQETVGKILKAKNRKSEPNAIPLYSEFMLRVRFAPSPTGFLHVGSARTFIFNWLYARRNGGTMVLRLDDTDVERNTEASVSSIFEGLRWLDLGWDEEYKQSERLALHRQIADAIFQKGLAYRDFTPAHAGDAEKSGPVKVDPKDLRVDTFSSPPSVAVRITHVPTGTVAVLSLIHI